MAQKGTRAPRRRTTPQSSRASARFIAPMLLLRTDTLPDGDAVGLRAEAGRLPRDRVQDAPAACTCARATTTTSASRYPAVVKGLAKLPDDTVDRRRGRRVRRRRPAVVQRAAELRIGAGARRLLRVRRDGARRPRRDARAARGAAGAARDEGPAEAGRAGPLRRRRSMPPRRAHRSP